MNHFCRRSGGVNFTRRACCSPGELRRRLLHNVQTAQRHVFPPPPPPPLHGSFPTSAQRYLAVAPSLLAVYADLLRRHGSSSTVVPSTLIPAASSSSSSSGLSGRRHPNEAGDVEASSTYLVSSTPSASIGSSTPRKPLSADISRYHPYGKTA